ncbi:hypothetical protein HOLleu_03051 [Holothuria leucospilota]|uniref:DUF4371 domain-containing protein n=1 Tax=Holothuria leucospilota TaxID=206669 RepID=A0A9Q1CQC2_HOLLE|nr:hypothetical protein HOLleu_03051 [Holothuria leucospilota]
MIYLFDIAYNIAKQELPFTQFSTWVNTEKKHGVLLGDTYINDIQCKNFINEIAFHMERDLREAIKQSPYIGIMFDGSTDASCTERENICIKYTENGYPVTKFLGITEPEFCHADGILSSLHEKFDEFEINLPAQLVGVSADGASVNFGSKNGILTKLSSKMPWIINTHCTAHRLELGVKDAFRNTYFDEVQ